MKIKNIKYKAFALGMGAATLFSTSCSDFLDGEIVDKFSSSSIQTYDNYVTLTKALYGGKKLSEYESKFNWVINDGAAGNLYNIYQNEGMPYLLQIGEQNDICTDGYRSLYSGLISTANQVINMDKPTLSEAEANEINAEARLFRAYGHFLATEYWGEVPLVWNNEKDIANDARLPRVTRKTLYTAIMKDLEFAMANLPASYSGAYQYRATKWAAEGLLAKLYLTIAACQTPTPKCSFVSQDMNLTADQCYKKVIDYTTEIIEKGGYKLTTHADLFKYKTDYPAESILAFRFIQGGWMEGAQYQCQMARSEPWSPGAGWGSGKGLSYTLYKSYDDNDARKKEVSMYVGETYYNEAKAMNVKYEKTPNALDKATSKDLLEAIGVLNNIKKYVWGASNSMHFMSGWARYDILRLSDMYMMRQEAKMLKDGSSETPYSDLADLNEVLSAHGAPEAKEPMAFYTKLDGSTYYNLTITIGGKKYTSRNGTADFQPMTDENKKGTAYAIPMYHNQKRTDFIQELRKEFAMEGRGWMDLKRFYYMNHDGAAHFLEEQDRGCSMTRSGAFADGADELYDERGYDRLSLLNDISRQRMADGETGLTVSSEEQKIYNDDFVQKCNWFLPFPSSSEVTNKLDMSAVKDFSQEILDGTYPY